MDGWMDGWLHGWRANGSPDSGLIREHGSYSHAHAA